MLKPWVFYNVCFKEIQENSSESIIKYAPKYALEVIVQLSYKPEHDKTYSKICVTSKGSHQPVHPPSLARILIHPLWIVLRL